MVLFSQLGVKLIKIKLNLLRKFDKSLPLAKHIHTNTFMKHIHYNITWKTYVYKYIYT
mgnify:CR=1 FL=1